VWKSAGRARYVMYSRRRSTYATTHCRIFVTREGREICIRGRLIRSRYNQEYPQEIQTQPSNLRNRNTNYRRYKRNPHYDERDYDSDEVFEQDEQPHGRRRWSHRD
jgi:hypothetical protein